MSTRCVAAVPPVGPTATGRRWTLPELGPLQCSWGSPPKFSRDLNVKCRGLPIESDTISGEQVGLRITVTCPFLDVCLSFLTQVSCNTYLYCTWLRL